MKKGKKVVAIVMAVLMIVGIMPFTSFSGIFSSKANAEVVTAELPTTNKAAGETVVEVGSAKFVASQALNAKTYEAGKELKDKDGNEYNKSLISTSVNNTKVQMAGDSKVATARTLGYLTTTEDQTITVVVKVPKGKKADFVTSDTNLNVPATKDNPVEITTGIERVTAGSEGDLVQIYTIEAVAGKYYYFMGEGTNLELLSISANVVKKAESESIEISKNVNYGETVGKALDATFVATQNLTYKEYEAGKELKDKDGNEYNKSLISTSVNNTKVQMAGDSKVATARTLGYLTTTEDQTITVVVKVPKGKKADFVTSDTNLNVPATKDNPVEITTGIERVTAGSEGDLVQIYTIEAVAGKYYYFMGEGTNLELLSFSAKKGGDEVRPDWSKVEAPVINEISQDKDTVKVTYTMDISNAGADNVKVIVKDSTGKEVAKEASKKCDDNKQGTVEIKLTASGTYTFSIVASRENEEDKAGTTDKAFDFLAPLKAASIKPVTGHGDGSATVSWEAVDEAESYIVSYKVTDADDSTYVDFYTGKETSATVSGLTAGTNYTFKVVAVRGNDKSEAATITKQYTDTAERDWNFSVFGGTGTSLTKNKYSGNIYTNDLILDADKGTKFCNNANADQVLFYYTKLNAKTENFTLSGKMSIQQMNSDGGQSGFGLIAMDSVGESGSPLTYFTNSVATYVGKVDYYYDSETLTAKPSNATSGIKLTEKNGIGARLKNGLKATGSADGCNVVMYSLDKKAVGLETGTYNIIDSEVKETTKEEENLDTIRDVNFTLKKDNSGYLCVYSDNDGNEIARQRIYDFDNENLTVIDPDNIYVGFFAARGVKVKITDTSLTTIAPEDDAPAEEVEYNLIDVTSTVTSTDATSSEDYELKYVANADGHITITDENGEVVLDQDVLAKQTVSAPTYKLTIGKNKFNVAFTPNADYQPSKYDRLSSYETLETTFTVTYRVYGEEGVALYVAPNANGSGSKEDPMSIYTAVKFVKPGQQIIIKEGTYYLDKVVKVNRGVNGTEDNMIYMIADPEASSRPVFNFQKASAGFIFAGDYWYIQGFDVTNSANKNKAVQVSGNHNTLDRIDAYYNGDTGIQISRLLATDVDKSMWPSYNTILNCTSYNNADATYADADGFAAKITVGDGNQFIGCISHSNADDGWDLFAYPDTGSIGKVRVYNCVAYNNGYVYKNEAGELDINGTKVEAGNGNGFKLGGNSISGYHELENCVSFGNAAKGIDCNSCPDIQVKNCITFNNESYNIALYTGSAKNTDFSSNGVISFRTEHKKVLDTDGTYINTTGEKGIKLVGSQDVAKVINDTSYYWNGTDSSNKSGVKVSADWFVSTDMANAKITRDADGSINLNGFLELTDKAPANAGARLVSTASKTIEAMPSITTYSSTVSSRSFVKGTSMKLVMTIQADMSLFDYVTVDDVVLDPSNYTVTSGSTIITFKESYVKKLGAGEHTIRVYFKDGMFAEKTIDVLPNTADSFGRMLPVYGGIMLAALIAVAFVLLEEKKRKRA